MGKMKIPKQFRKAVDELKDEVVEKIFSKARIIREDMKKFKEECFSEVELYMEVLGSEYEAKAYNKGNITLTNFDNTKKFQINTQNLIQFDEKLQVAKGLIDKCISKWIDSSRDEIKTLINFAFEVDKAGKVSISRVLSLRKIDIRDEDWQNAMQAITDSLEVVSRKSYLRLQYRKDIYSEWKNFGLDLASLNIEEGAKICTK